MADNTSIEWTDATWNPVRGCSRLSPGCGGPNRQGGCYAEKIAARFSDPGQPFHGFAERTAHGGRWTGKMALVEDMLDQPLRWRKPRRIFVNSMSDLFHKDLPDEAIDRVVAVMARARRHTLQVLTKRSDRMRAYMSTEGRAERIGLAMRSVGSGLTEEAARGWLTRYNVEAWPLPNVWLGVSVEDQERANERIPDLLATPAAVRFLSCEPLLGSVDLSRWLDRTAGGRFHAEPILDWVIAGGESGPRARPAHPDWFRSLRDQCTAAGVPFFFKQWGEWAPGECATTAHTRTERVASYFNGEWGFGSITAKQGEELHRDDAPDVWRLGKKAAGATLDGREWREMPA